MVETLSGTFGGQRNLKVYLIQNSLMRALTALLLTALAPVAAFAQTLVGSPTLAQPTAESRPLFVDELLKSGAAGEIRGTSAAMPLWSTPDGRILALIALSTANAGPTLPQSPQVSSAADWRLVDVTSFLAGAVTLKLADNASAYANFGRGIVLAPVYLNPSASDCAIAGPSGSCGNEIVAARSGSLAIGTDFTAGNLDIDLNYGLSWLHFNDVPGSSRPAADLFANIGNEALPTLVIPGYEFANLASAGIGAQSRWKLDDTQTVGLGAALGRVQIELPGLAATSTLNQAALSFGLHRGDFSGLIVGRVLGPNDPLNGTQHWSSIDLGISWRAPWRGVFSVGAQNIWSSGSLPTLADPAAAHEIDPAQARVPYVQYHQDL